MQTMHDCRCGHAAEEHVAGLCFATRDCRCPWYHAVSRWELPDDPEDDWRWMPDDPDMREDPV